jgi:glycosyltransferase involved in cell wall biosynthesis
LELAREFPNVHIHQHPFTGFGHLRNVAANLAKYEWILALDSDEVLPQETISSLLDMELDPQIVYGFSRKNLFQGKWIKGCGWYPDHIYRLYNKNFQSWLDEEKVHESLAQKGRKLHLFPEFIEHTPYRCFDDFLSKLTLYSGLYALQHRGKKEVSYFSAFYHSIWAFFKSYFLQKGFLLGAEGWIISIYNAHACHYKYLKLLEHNIKALSSMPDKKI